MKLEEENDNKTHITCCIEKEMIVKNYMKKIIKLIKYTDENSTLYSDIKIDCLYSLMILNALDLIHDDIDENEPNYAIDENSCIFYSNQIEKSKKHLKYLKKFQSLIQKINEIENKDNSYFLSENEEIGSKKRRINPKTKYKYRSAEIQKKRNTRKKVKLETHRTKSSKFY